MASFFAPSSSSSSRANSYIEYAFPDFLNGGLQLSQTIISFSFTTNSSYVPLFYLGASSNSSIDGDYVQLRLIDGLLALSLRIVPQSLTFNLPLSDHLMPPYLSNNMAHSIRIVLNATTLTAAVDSFVYNFSLNVSSSPFTVPSGGEWGPLVNIIEHARRKC